MSFPFFLSRGKCPTPRFREGQMSEAGGKCPKANVLHSMGVPTFNSTEKVRKFSIYDQVLRLQQVNV